MSERHTIKKKDLNEENKEKKKVLVMKETPNDVRKIVILTLKVKLGYYKFCAKVPY